MSQAMAVPPMLLASSSRRSLRRADTTTLQPSRASVSAASQPLPPLPDAPATTATFPLSCIFCSSPDVANAPAMGGIVEENRDGNNPYHLPGHARKNALT